MTNSKKITLLLVVNSFGGGGAENIMKTLHQAFIGHQINSNLLSVTSDNFTPVELNSHEFTLDRHWNSGLTSNFSEIGKFRSIVKSINPDVIILNCEIPEFYFAFSRLKIKKVLCVEHTSNPWRGRKLLGILIRLLLKFRGVDWITVNKNQRYIWPLMQRCQHIPNPQFSSGTKSSKGTPLVAYIGRLSKEKRPDIAISACTEVNFPIEVYGNGILEKSLKQKYKDKNCIRFNGYVQEVWNQIPSNSLIIIPSEYEGDGLVVVEAVCNGHSVLLADNEDLRRFELPDINYFKSEKDLVNKLNEVTLKDFSRFKPSASLREIFLHDRDLSMITEEWIKLIKV